MSADIPGDDPLGSFLFRRMSALINGSNVEHFYQLYYMRLYTIITVCAVATDCIVFVRVFLSL